jgi:nicotinamide riboside kinase
MTASCLEKYRKDLDALVAEAFWVEQSLTLMYTDRDKYVADLTNSLKGDAEKVAVFMKKIQPFPTAYQEWYSEAVTLVRQLMPDRLNDFIKLYEKPKA